MREMTVFDKILDKSLPCEVYLESEDFLAFKDISPKARIHALVIPKEYFKDFNEVSPQCMAKMTSFMQELALLLGVDQSGYKIVSNCGAGGGQEVFYLHFHLLAN